MSMLDDNFIAIPLYYKMVKTKYGSQHIVVLEDEQASKMLENEEQRAEVQILNTRWKTLGWKDTNDLMKESETVGAKDAETGIAIPSFDWAKYQDIRVKRSLAWWDLKAKEDDPEPLPVTSDNIDRMPAHVIRALLDKFDGITNIDEEELGK